LSRNIKVQKIDNRLLIADDYSRIVLEQAASGMYLAEL